MLSKPVLLLVAALARALTTSPGCAPLEQYHDCNGDDLALSEVDTEPTSCLAFCSSYTGTESSFPMMFTFTQTLATIT